MQLEPLTNNSCTSSTFLFLVLNSVRTKVLEIMMSNHLISHVADPFFALIHILLMTSVVVGMLVVEINLLMYACKKYFLPTHVWCLTQPSLVY